MSNSRRNVFFKNIHDNRSDMYNMYLNSITKCTKGDYISKLETFCLEITNSEYKFNEISEINRAISNLDRFRNKQIKHLKNINMNNKECRVTYNGFILSMDGIGAILYNKYRGECSSDKIAINKMQTSLASESNSYTKFMNCYKDGAFEILTQLSEIASTRCNSDAICKIVKHLKRRLQRLRADLSLMQLGSATI